MDLAIKSGCSDSWMSPHVPDLPVIPAKLSYSWFALQIRARYERVVAAHLAAKSFEWFLPLYKHRSRWSDRYKEIERPLFPGYVFCRLDPTNRLCVLVTPGVVGIVGVGKTPSPIDETEISSIRTAVSSGLPSQPCKFLKVGQKVRIDYGPLSGLVGILLDFRRSHRLVLSVSLLQRSIAVQVDDAWVTPLRTKAQPSAEQFTGLPVGPPHADHCGTHSTEVQRGVC